MKIESQVCTLEQALKLKALGVTQKSYFTWLEVSNGDDEGDFQKPGVEWHPVLCVENKFMESLYAVSYVDPDWTTSDGEFCGMRDNAAAFTVAELGQMCGSETYTQRTGTETSEYANWEWVDDSRREAMGPFATEAEARADMLIRMLENGSLTDIEVNKRSAVA